ncbi:leucine-rich repeat flightless-interacting protein 2-like [Argiope bruennichi]|uniref:Leucine-rich repeat flightless-interacting like protein n=1 Tax=Argiope bruennichi TaxID=94029 RepID=A0A8T0FGS8_ARGBR|nr:leucine-rich repeat flightless-interacting protein 2-like [Argiope bruennichi]KAF8788520.1 Leucine-rich repeat flightless-interacting like protein [Argiope bruennichi]
MATSSSGRRRVATKLYAAEDQAFNQIAKEAEARLAARRQARAEAREIRMKELEKLQKEADEQSDRHYELLTDVARNTRPSVEARTPSYMSGTSSYASSRRSSEDSTDNLELRTGLIGRDLKFQLSDLEEKFRKAMISNAQLDNEKTAYIYQVETLKDEIEEMQENLNQSQREYREKKRVYDQLMRDYKNLQQENECLLHNLKQRDQLIQEHGLVLVSESSMNGDISEEYESNVSSRKKSKQNSSTALLSQRSALLLDQVGNGSLDVRLKKFIEEKQELLDEIYRLRLDLEEERQKLSKMENSSVNHNHVNGPDIKVLEVQREANKQVSDYKFRLKKAEQEITTLQSNISRLESQVARYKAATENAEKTEDDLKAEKRKILREFREAQSRIEELETSNTHLQKRIDKLKSARTALIKS